MIRDSDIEKRENKVHGIKRGRVIDVDDPYKAGRVKVDVFSVFDDFNESDIPWAQYADPFMGGSENKGGLFVPDKGDLVWVFFEESDPRQPVYFAGAPAKPHLPSNKDKDYPKTKVYKTSTGHYLEITDDGHIQLYHSSGNNIEFTSEDIKLKHQSGSVLSMDDTGNIHSIATNSLILESSNGNTVEITKSGINIQELMGSIASVNASGIVLNSGAATFSVNKNGTIKASSTNFNV